MHYKGPKLQPTYLRTHLPASPISSTQSLQVLSEDCSLWVNALPSTFSPSLFPTILPSLPFSLSSPSLSPFLPPFSFPLSLSPFLPSFPSLLLACFPLTHKTSKKVARMPFPWSPPGSLWTCSIIVWHTLHSGGHVSLTLNPKPFESQDVLCSQCLSQCYVTFIFVC